MSRWGGYIQRGPGMSRRGRWLCPVGRGGGCGVFAHTIVLLVTDYKWLQVQFTEQKTGNNISKFIHSNWTTQSYTVSSVWCTSLTSVHYNLEHGLAILTESFSPLNLNYTTTLSESELKVMLQSHTIPDGVYLPCTLNWFQLVKGLKLILMQYAKCYTPYCDGKFHCWYWCWFATN